MENPQIENPVQIYVPPIKPIQKEIKRIKHQNRFILITLCCTLYIFYIFEPLYLFLSANIFQDF